jgi:hypothetical protein
MSNCPLRCSFYKIQNGIHLCVRLSPPSIIRVAFCQFVQRVTQDFDEMTFNADLTKMTLVKTRPTAHYFICYYFILFYFAISAKDICEHLTSTASHCHWFTDVIFVCCAVVQRTLVHQFAENENVHCYGGRPNDVWCDLVGMECALLQGLQYLL